MRAFYLLVCLIFSIAHPDGFSAQCFAQGQENGLTALKFDEYRLNFRHPADEESRLARFARQLKREPSAKAHIIAYTPRVLNFYGSSYWYIAANRCLATKAELAGRYGVEEHRLICIDGGVREDASLELWILPRNASPPIPRPEFQRGDLVHCYPVRASGEAYVLQRDKPLKFTAFFNLGKPPTEVRYAWSVSSGKIIDGQGQNTITVDVSGASEKEVTAEVEVKGLSAECHERASFTTAVDISPYKLSEFEENYSEALQINLDNLTVILQKEPSLQGFIIVYGGRIGERSYARMRGERARYYLTEVRGMSADRFAIVEGGHRERPMIEVWLVPRNGQKPTATPSVDPRYVKFIGSPTKRRKVN